MYACYNRNFFVVDVYNIVQTTQVYKKAVFREYTDDTFTTQVLRDESMGILGPPIRAAVCS